MEIKTLPVVALRGVTVLPGMVVHFDVSRKKSLKAVEAAMSGGQEIFLIAQKNENLEEVTREDLHQTGCAAKIKQVVRLPKELSRVLVEGLVKAEPVELRTEGAYLEADLIAVEKPEKTLPESADTAMCRALKELFEVYCAQGAKIGKDTRSKIQEMDDLSRLMEEIAVSVPMDWKSRQRILDTRSETDLFEELGAILNKEIAVGQLNQEIQKKLKARVDKGQREYLLREQMKVIREELGEDNEKLLNEYRQKVEALNAPKEVKEKLLKDIDRLSKMNGNMTESTVLTAYLETMLELPWNYKTEDACDLKESARILEESHYGLKDVKERVMEFLAVRTLTGKGRSPILCLAGPPGTGKTSIAKSVAECLNKKYVRICLGGVRDEAEIRGHRKTYVGAMPGRITNALKQAGTANPLMLLDEIDKTSSDYKGDTSSALLEVLDPEQNSRFTDHYVEVPQDLSEVFFIATANNLQNIPKPLLDRMEIIEIPGYTENEKRHIALEYLIPRQTEVNGIGAGKLVIQQEALNKIITGYTREAGVRGLEKKIGQICRKAARTLAEGKKTKVTVTAKNLSDFLGRERNPVNPANEKPEIGIVRGLAWTQVGGDTLEIEVNTMSGKGEIVLTGQLGDVMKESARTGISFIRSMAESYQIPKDYFEKHDIHVHIPEGAVPKDGPSAGITMATAILSAIIEKPVRADLAMTGEITLRGRVLPIGGLREKLLAAKAAGIRQVLIPVKNVPDIEEMDREIKAGLEITPVSTMQEVLDYALVKEE